MNRPDPCAAPDALLELLSALERALIAETDALRARNVEALEQAVAGKRQALGALGRIRPTLSGDGNDGPAASAVAALLCRCRELNEIAGGAIATLRQDTSQALGLLGIESEAPGYGAPARPARPGRALAVC